MPDETTIPNPLSADTIPDLDDGAVRAVIDTALDEMMADCDGRPALEKARTLTVEIDMVPIPHETTGGMRGVAIQTKVKTKVPPRQTHGSILRTTIQGDRALAMMPDAHATPLFEARNREGGDAS